MKKPAIGLLACFVGLFALVFVHDAVPPATTQVSATGRWGVFEFVKFKDGGSVGIRLRTKEGREEILVLDRSFVRSEGGDLRSREDGLLYFGTDAQSAGLSLRPKSQVFEDFQSLLDHQQRRWSVRLGIVDGGYNLMLSDFALALDRTKRAIQSATDQRP